MAFVVFYHVNIELRVMGRDPLLAPIDAGPNVEFGQLGTVLFIILAGFTSVLSYERIDKQGTQRAGSYYRKRLLAILPAFYIAYFLAFILILLPSAHLNWRFVFTLLGVDGYLSAHGVQTFYLVGEWFTGCILALYLLFPLIYLAAKKQPVLTLILAVALKVGAILLIFRTGLTDCDILFYGPDFIFGVLAALYLKKPNLYLGFGALALSILLFIVKIPVNYRFMISPLGLSVFVAVLMLVGKLEEKAALKGLRKIFSPIARYSYAVFLTHHVLILRVFGSADPNMGRKQYLLYFLIFIFFTAGSAVIVQSVADTVKKALFRRSQ